MLLELDEQTQQWIATNSDRRWALLLDYWNSLAQRLGRMPSRTDIDPLDLPADMLPNIFLVDVVREPGVAEPRFRFRLLGSAITARERVRPGQFLDEFRGAELTEDMARQYLDCLGRRVRVRSTNLAWDHPTKEFITYRVILLPLSSNQVDVETLIGLAVYEA